MSAGAKIFHSQWRPDDALIRGLAAANPRNPFYTPAFVAARSNSGEESLVLWRGNDESIDFGCTAFMRKGRVSRTLEIPSLPAEADEAFWRDVENFCRSARITDLAVESFGASRAAIPALSLELSRRKRREFVLPLSDSAGRSMLSQGHRRNIARAERAGVAMRVEHDAAACSRHSELMTASMQRRHSRGEDISVRVAAATLTTYARHAAGSFYQALHEGEVVSSVLVLLAERGAYYHSAGTNPRGMELGASHFLINAVAHSLASDGREVFNLGGADAPGLIRFKSGFGAHEVELEAARFFFGSTLLRRLSSAWRDLRSRSRRALARKSQPTSFA